MIRTTPAHRMWAAVALAGRLSLVPVSSLALITTTSALLAGPARAEDPGQQLNDALAAYEQSQFDSAIKLATDALKSGQLNAADATRAREIIARAQVKAGRRADGRQVFRDILRVDPGYRPDPVRMPPDEMEVFNQALAAFQTELIDQGKRIPASISAHYGEGWNSNTDMSHVVQAGGGEAFNGGLEFGGAVRFPIRSKWSLDIELSRFREAQKDSFPAPNDKEVVVSALPLTVSAHYGLISGPKWRMSGFVGAGPMLVSEARINVPISPTIKLSVSANKTGFIAHAGLEGEWLLMKRLGLYGRMVGRIAKATGLDFGEVNLYGTPIGKRDVNFSGLALHAGVRAYIGY